MKQKLNTMTELSDAIDISRPTLSRYFEDPESVRKSTRLAIERGLERFDYVPNFFARNMNRKRTKVLGIVIPTLRDLFYSSLVEVIDRKAVQNDYTVIVQSSHGDEKHEYEALESLRAMNADGVIIASVGGERNLDAFYRLNRDLPLVFLDSMPELGMEQMPFVGTDNAQSIRLLVDYLCRSGKPPVFLGMPRVNTNSTQRAKVYQEQMRALGHEAEIINASSAHTSWQFENYGYEFMREKFASGQYLDATILCANDRLAIGVLRAANEYNLFAGHGPKADRLRVAGHDDHPLSQFVWPSLTTASQKIDELGLRAFELFTQCSNEGWNPGTSNGMVLFEANLVLRDSA